MKRLQHICASFRTRLKALLLQAGIVRLIVVALSLLLPAMLLDWWLLLRAAWRASALALYSCALIATLYCTLLTPLGPKWRDVAIVRFLDYVAPLPVPPRSMLP